MKYTVLLQSGTIGIVESETLSGQSAQAFLGDEINVHFHDENGNPAEERGILQEVLEESDY
jgi:hypothetical protein